MAELDNGSQGVFDRRAFGTSRGGAAIVSAFDTQAVPDPATLCLLVAGLAGIGARRSLRWTVEIARRRVPEQHSQRRQAEAAAHGATR